jgi:hypothetical protein
MAQYLIKTISKNETTDRTCEAISEIDVIEACKIGRDVDEYIEIFKVIDPQNLSIKIPMANIGPKGTTIIASRSQIRA